MYQPKDTEVYTRQLKVQRLVIPFVITANATPSSKTLTNDDPQILSLQTQGISQIPNPNAPSSPAGTVALASAANYGILAATAITTVNPSTITGSLAESPGSTVTGTFTVSGSTDLANSNSLQAKNDAQTAYNTYAAMSTTVIPSALDGQTLTAGAYSFTSGAATLAASGNGTLTLNGSATDVFVIKTASTLSTGAGGIPTITLTGGAVAANVFWLVGSSATINIGVTSAGATFHGTIIAVTSITATQTSPIDGRLLALGGSVTLSDHAAITIPGGSVPSLFDLAVSDSTGKFNLMVNIAPGEVGTYPLLYNGDRYVKFVSASVLSRTGGGGYLCYHNVILPDFDPTLTKLYLNCSSGVNFSTTSLDACLHVEYIAYE